MNMNSLRSADAALAALSAGNARFRAGLASEEHRSPARRLETFERGQSPIATVLACSDSRCPVELIFGQGIGDLFVVRVGGNMADSAGIGTIEFAVRDVGTPLLVVLGHTGCAAVMAAVEGRRADGAFGRLLEQLAPARLMALEQNPHLEGQELVLAAIRMNIWRSIDTLRDGSSVIREAEASGALRIVGALYDMREGTVAWLEGRAV